MPVSTVCIDVTGAARTPSFQVLRRTGERDDPGPGTAGRCHYRGPSRMNGTGSAKAR